MSAEPAVSETTALLATVEAFFIRLTQAGIVREWAGQAEKILGIALPDAFGKILQDLAIEWSWEDVGEAVRRTAESFCTVRLEGVRFVSKDGRQRFLKLSVSPLYHDLGIDLVIMGEDITERLELEHELAQAQKLESIGRLASGIAHEINTPIQFVGDNLRFLADSFSDLGRVVAQYQRLLAAVQAGTGQRDVLEKSERTNAEVDLAYLLDEIPKALAQSTEGIDRVAIIVRAMKEFAHPGGEEKILVDLNKAIESTVTVARNEWKYVADLHTALDPTLPPVPCLIGAFNQVMLNMIVNAAHAIADVVTGTGGKGTITIRTGRTGDFAEIRISDTGSGIPASNRHRIFDPFFTTKEVGKGTGQGLAIARAVVVGKHGGSIEVESEVGTGTTFLIRLPLAA